MQEQQDKQAKTSSRKRGCLISALVALVLMAYSFWQIGEPGRRARRMREAIEPGMSFENVEALLEGRHICSFQAKTNGQWRTISRDEFTDYMTTKYSGMDTVPLRLQLHFLGMTPRRSSFMVELNGDGNVTNVTSPRGWD